MSKIIIFFGLATLATLGVTLDCSSIYYKESEGVLNYLGNVTFKVPSSTPNGWTIYFNFDRNFTGIGVWAGTIVADEEAGTARMMNNSVNGQLKAGEDFSFRFRVNWKEDTPAKNPPVLVSLRFLDVELCN